MTAKELKLSQADKETYLKFIEWQKNSWYGAPGGERLLPVVASSYTPEEAGFLTGFPFSPGSIDALAELKGISKSDLSKKAGRACPQRTAVPL